MAEVYRDSRQGLIVKVAFTRENRDILRHEAAIYSTRLAHCTFVPAFYGFFEHGDVAVIVLEDVGVPVDWSVASDEAM